MRNGFLFGICALLVTPAALMAGPFGIEMGQQISELDTLESDAKIELQSVPNPHPLFDSYSVWHTETLGVCRILAITPPYENDPYGTDVLSDYQRVAGAVGDKYGTGRTMESLRVGAIWDEPRDWVMSLAQGERVHATDWSNVALEGEEYSLIQLWVDAAGSDTSFMVLEYRAAFFDDCLEEIEGAADDAF